MAKITLNTTVQPKGIDAAKNLAVGVLKTKKPELATPIDRASTLGQLIVNTKKKTNDPWAGKVTEGTTFNRVVGDPVTRNKDALPKGAWTEKQFKTYLIWFNRKNPSKNLEGMNTVGQKAKADAIANELNIVRKSHGLPSKSAAELKTFSKTGIFASAKPKPDVKDPWSGNVPADYFEKNPANYSQPAPISAPPPQPNQPTSTEENYQPELPEGAWTEANFKTYLNWFREEYVISLSDDKAESVVEYLNIIRSSHMLNPLTLDEYKLVFDGKPVTTVSAITNETIEIPGEPWWEKLWKFLNKTWP